MVIHVTRRDREVTFAFMCCNQRSRTQQLSELKVTQNSTDKVHYRITL
ncbi:hypothetical protein ABKN59_011772 [Abortiporus biennis]